MDAFNHAIPLVVACDTQEKRVTDAMLKMAKLDIGTLRAACGS